MCLQHQIMQISYIASSSFFFSLESWMSALLFCVCATIIWFLWRIVHTFMSTLWVNCGIMCVRLCCAQWLYSFILAYSLTISQFDNAHPYAMCLYATMCHAMKCVGNSSSISESECSLFLCLYNSLIYHIITATIRIVRLISPNKWCILRLDNLTPRVDLHCINSSWKMYIYKVKMFTVMIECGS